MPGDTVTEEDVIGLRQKYRGALLVTEGGRAFEVAALDARLAGRSLPAQIFFYCGAPHWKLHLLLHDASANMPALQRAVAAWLEKAQQDPECPELLRPPGCAHHMPRRKKPRRRLHPAGHRQRAA